LKIFQLNILNRLIKLLLILFLLAFNFSFIHSQNSWSTFIDSVSTFSSPRSADLNLDGTKDIVLGAGTDSTYSNYGVVALNGVSGQLLWNLPTPDEIFSSAVFIDINNDTIPDVFIGGRNAQLYAIDGSNGNIIWEFFPQNSGLYPADSGLYNFYSSQICDDYDGDNVNDILVTNGGDHKASPFDPRPPGYLMLISGASGNLIAKAVSPDSAEIYCSPVIVDRNGGMLPEIIFGTGGEHHGGGMYVTNFNDLLNGDISNSILLTSHPSKGFIAPASIADVSDDGYNDFIVQSFSGELSAFDGLTFQTLWSRNFPGCESSAAPTIGNFTGGDLVPDVFTVVYRGTTPTYFDYYQVMLNGLTGEISWIDSIGSMHFSSSSAFDSNGDGRDEVLFSVNYITSFFSHQLKMVDFQNDSVMDIGSLNPGVNLGCSPLIDDLDDDGLIEFIYTYKYDSLNPSAWNGFYFNRLNTNFSSPYRGVAWGAYMGTSYTGHYTRNLSLCTSLTNMISIWDIAQPSCNNFNDGSVFPSIINTIPNTYLWSDGSVGDTLQNASAGIHTLYITDTNNCVEYHQFQLNDPYYISFGNINHNNCIGDSIGTATVSSSGCICQFSTCTYNWDNGSLIKHATNLPSGMHHVIITHPDGCLVEDSVFINEGLPVVDSSLVTNKSCFYINDGQIELFPNNPSTTNYSWSNNTSQSINSHLSSGPYWVILNNTFCSDSLYFNILSPDSIFINYSYQDALCYGDSNGIVELSPTAGFSPFSYVMDGIIYSDSLFENLSVGNYQFYIKDSSNCNSDTINLSINQPDSLDVTFTVVPESDSGFFDGSVIASGLGGTIPYYYSWSNNPSINDSIILYLSNDYYILSLSDDNGCQLIDSVYVGIVSDFSLISNDFLKIYPIPSIGNIFLTNYYTEPVKIKIFELSGKLVKNSFSLNPFDKYSMSFPKGNFVAEIKTRNSISFQKFIILD
jgi:hypothetical protein